MTELRMFVQRTLNEFGAQNVRFEQGGKHPKVRFTARGVEQMRVFSATPSDWRSRMNLRSELRHACGLVGKEDGDMLQQQTNGNGKALVKPQAVFDDTALSLYEVSADDEEPRVRDVDLAVRLGMRQPDAIRRIIRHHEEKLSNINALTQVRATNKTNGVAFTDFYLDRRQAMFVAIRANTPASDDVAMELVEIYDRWRQGTLPQHPKAAANLATDATVAILTQIRDGISGTNSAIQALRDDQGATFDALANLEARIAGVEERAALPAPTVDEPEPEPEPTHMKLVDWLDARAIEYGNPHGLGGPVGVRLRSLARRDGVELRRQFRNTGHVLYPVEFLDNHADDIRRWLDVE